MRARMVEELAHLRRYYPGAEHAVQGGEDWFQIPNFVFPDGWQIGQERLVLGPIAFKIGVSYPAGEPYGFAAPAGINFRGVVPGSPGSPVSPPFNGAWQHFSWAPDGWSPTDLVREGSNLVVWARSFTQRLTEGA